jgi:hypothetical protein
VKKKGRRGSRTEDAKLFLRFWSKYLNIIYACVATAERSSSKEASKGIMEVKDGT